MTFPLPSFLPFPFPFLSLLSSFSFSLSLCMLTPSVSPFLPSLRETTRPLFSVAWRHSWRQQKEREGGSTPKKKRRRNHWSCGSYTTTAIILYYYDIHCHVERERCGCCMRKKVSCQGGVERPSLWRKEEEEIWSSAAKKLFRKVSVRHNDGSLSCQSNFNRHHHHHHHCRRSRKTW